MVNPEFQILVTAKARKIMEMMHVIIGHAKERQRTFKI